MTHVLRKALMSPTARKEYEQFLDEVTADLPEKVCGIECGPEELKWRIQLYEERIWNAYLSALTKPTKQQLKEIT